MRNFVVMDAETKMLAKQVQGGWDNIYGHGMSSAVTYSSASDKYKFWPSDQRDALCSYLNKQVVVTFNGIMFDSKLLLGNDRVIEDNGATSNDKYSWINADIYVEMWRHILQLDRSDYSAIVKKIQEQKFPKNVFGLDPIAKNTLGVSKSGEGAHAPDLFQQGRLLELFEYNLQDVRVTRQLYMFIKQWKYVITGGFDIVSFARTQERK
jgi:hypothetical protein